MISVVSAYLLELSYDSILRVPFPACSKKNLLASGWLAFSSKFRINSSEDDNLMST